MQRTITRSEWKDSFFWAKIAALGIAAGAAGTMVARYLEKKDKYGLSKQIDNVQTAQGKIETIRTLYGGNRIEAPDSKMLWDVNFRGFLPSRDPVREVPTPFAFLVDIVEKLPTLCVRQNLHDELEHYRSRLEELPVRYFHLLDSDALRQRVHSLYSYIAAAYLVELNANSDTAGALGALPAHISLGYTKIADLVGRKPSFDYCDCVLYNWERINKKGPLLPSNLRLLNRFTGTAPSATHAYVTPLVSACRSHFV